MGDAGGPFLLSTFLLILRRTSQARRRNAGKARSNMARYWRISIWLLIAVAVAAALPAQAEQKKPPAKAPQPNQQQAQPDAPTSPAQDATLPDAFKLNLLIRASIIALNQANQTGNYTVLQDLGAPAFRASNNSARLAQIFGALRQRQLDLSPVLFFTPKLTAQPRITPNGLLRLAGFFPTTPERVNFDLIYQLIDGQWRLFGIGVSTSPADVTSAMPQQPPAPATAQAAQKPDAAPRPARKSQAESQGGATNNAARIDLANPNPAPAGGSPK
jgi:hypothetical protein